MGLLSDLFSSSDPEGAIEECSDALELVWKNVEGQLSEQERKTIFPRFIRHPFVLGTVYGFIQPVARNKGVEVGTDDFNGVLAATLESLVGLEVSMELGDEINRLWINPSEGDSQFKKGLNKGVFAGEMYVEELQNPDMVLTREEIEDEALQGPMPVYAKPLLDSYKEVLKDDLI